MYSMVNKSVSATNSNKCAAFDRADESFHLALCAQARIGRLAMFPHALVEESLIRIRDLGQALTMPVESILVLHMSQFDTGPTPGTKRVTWSPSSATAG